MPLCRKVVPDAPIIIKHTCYPCQCIASTSPLTYCHVKVWLHPRHHLQQAHAKRVDVSSPCHTAVHVLGRHEVNSAPGLSVQAGVGREEVAKAKIRELRGQQKV